ncbi:putative manganese-dependent inorganic diphosphatase [Curtanaerobium respiraculi]|uniref:putative manganese-dependent inorganic diphosphatase n=1 Tax=Curtanaerobium respiraculi TaxID=2949669 RepID=UPI0024B376D8|nr:putative manganese-dependent inorganic diphosphatase [Curtanaerobium respiraculi]
MSEYIRKVYITGHLHPDTDSICAALSYAYLKNQLGEDTPYEARRAGSLNRETQFVLDHFGFDEPPLLVSVAPQVKDLAYQRLNGIDGETSLYDAWKLMGENNLDTLCIADEDRNLQGLIALKDIAQANLNIFDKTILGASGTTYKNVVTTLQGTLLQGCLDCTMPEGRISVGTSPEMMQDHVHEGDVVLTTNRIETQRFAVLSGAKCLVVCKGAKVSDEVLSLAGEVGCAIVATPLDTYEAARVISMAVPVRAQMLPAEKIVSFNVDTPLSEAQKTIAQTRHRFFPVLNEDGKFVGSVTPPNLLDVSPKHVILVDHNEKSQAVRDLDDAVIMEIIDHHRIGSVETTSPAVFRAEPVGCTCTILYSIFQEKGIEIPANIAGLMMSAILSDTLCFRSPTCTPRDKHAGEQLARICGEDIEEYADAMFDAGAALDGRTAEDVFHQDFKVFSRGDVKFGVGQGSFMTENSRKAAEGLVGPYLPEGAKDDDLPVVFYLFTDVKTSSSEIMWTGEDAEEVVRRAFNVEPEGGIADLPGVVSRKKQVVPAIMTAMASVLEERG